MDEQFSELESRVEEMIHAKGWADEHTPKNVSMSIAIEAAELLELFQWDDPDRPTVIADETRHQRVREEVADVLIYCLSLGIQLDIDLLAAVDEKLEDNDERFPDR